MTYVVGQREYVYNRDFVTKGVCEISL